MLDMQEDSTAQVLMLGDFHKRGSVEILVSVLGVLSSDNFVHFRIQPEAKNPKHLISAIG